MVPKEFDKPCNETATPRIKKLIDFTVSQLGCTLSDLI